MTVIALGGPTDVYAMSCSVSVPSQSVSCSAVIKRDKSDLSQAASQNCASNGFLAFDSSSASFSECNSQGSKCKKISGKCKPKVSGGGLVKPKPYKPNFPNGDLN